MKVDAREVVRDGMALAGLACVTYGTSLLSVPAAWIVCGALLIVAAAFSLRRTG